MFLDQIGYEKPVEVSTVLSHANDNILIGRKRELSNHALSFDTYTSVVTNPWIRLDLEDSYFIRELDIFVHQNRKIEDFAIRIGRN